MFRIAYFFFLISIQLLCGCGINGKRNYLETNKNPETIKYSDSSCYSRAITIDKGSVLIANSNGKIYRTSLASNSNYEYSEEGNLEELRDIAVVDNIIYAIQSGSTGKLIEIMPVGVKTNIREYDFWNGVFLDGMDFKGNTGFIMGDPMNDLFSLYYTTDGGKTWTPCEGKIKAEKGEAGYAASGTNVQVLNDSTFVFASGGTKNRFFKSTNCGKSWSFSEIPFNTGEVIGCFSICFKNENEGVAVGGDHNNPLETSKTCFYTSDGGKTWKASISGIRGFRSCLLYKNEIFYCCGKNGIDYSTDNGATWKPFADGNYFAMTCDEQYLYATTVNTSFVKVKLVR